MAKTHIKHHNVYSCRDDSDSGLHGSKGAMLLLMEEILHQFKVVCPIIYMVLYISGGAGFLPKTVGQVKF